jgi:hypothetical protein
MKSLGVSEFATDVLELEELFEDELEFAAPSSELIALI